MTEKDLKLQEACERFAADMLIDNGRSIERVYDVERQIVGIDIISNYKNKLNVKIDVKHCIPKSASLGWDIAETNNANNPNGSKPFYKPGWFNRKDSVTDCYIQYMLMPTNDGRYLFEEYSIEKAPVKEFYLKKMAEHNMPLNTTSEEGRAALKSREALNNDKNNPEFDADFIIRHTSEKDKDNENAEHITTFFLTKVDFFVDNFKQCRVKYYLVDTNDVTKITYQSATLLNNITVTHKYNSKAGRYEAIIARG